MSTKFSRGLRASTAIQRINQRGALLVFPINNRAQPPSLWSEFFPNSKMVWRWDEDSDDRIGAMWQLMKQLSDCREVVYSKWYQGRATFFSRELFTAMLYRQRTRREWRQSLAQTAQILLEVLENNSPLSTKQLKQMTGLRGRENEADYNRAMKQLFASLLIVGYGEVDDGAFPSLAVGATELLFEDLWKESETMRPERAQATMDRLLPLDSPFRRALRSTSAQDMLRSP